MTLDDKRREIQKLERVVADIEACPRSKDILDSCARYGSVNWPRWITLEMVDLYRLKHGIK